MIDSVVVTDVNAYTVTFSPPLREDYASGARVEFQRPTCTMKMDIKARKGMWPDFQARFKVEPTFAFVEADVVI
jgi:hypothetical protein